MEEKRYHFYLSVCITVFVISCIGIYFGAKFIVDMKDDRLYNEACEGFNKYFHDGQHTVYAKLREKTADVVYEEMELPELSKMNKPDYHGPRNPLQLYYIDDFISDSTFCSDVLSDYPLKDIYKLYKVFVSWRFTIMEAYSSYRVKVYDVYPIMVGYVKGNSPSYRKYYPVKEIVNMEFDRRYDDNYKYHISNLSFSDLRKDIDNRYYELSSRYGMSVDELYYIGYELLNYEEIDFVEYTLYGGTNLSFIERTGSTYAITYNYFDDPKKVDRFVIMAICYTIICAAFIYCIIRITQKRRMALESLKSKLLRRVNPKNFMNPFDETTVNIANDIYVRLQATSSDDDITLKQIRKEIADKLKINFTDKNLLKKLQKNCNPQNFMNPYNEEKVRTANLLYAKLQNSNLTIDELEEIQKEYETKLGS